MERFVVTLARENGSGGRVIGLTAVEDTLPQAIEEAYTLTGMVHFENAYCRRDIGARAMKAFKEA